MNSVQSSVTSDQLDGKRPLPEGWVWTTVGDVVSFEYGKGLTQDKRDASGKVPVYGSNGIVGYHSAALIDKPCLVIGRKGAAGAVHKSDVPCWPIDTTYFAIPPENVNLSFLYYLFLTLDLASLDRSTAIPGLNRNDAYAVNIPLPPLPEQERIVTRLEELLSNLEAGVAALGRVRAGVKRYKASVLKAACEGKLFGDKGIENGELPEGWRWAKIDEIADTIGGVTKGRNLTGKATIMLPYLRVANVQRGRLDLDVMKEIEILASEAEKYRLQDGDVVLTEGGDWDKLGRSAIWRNQIPNCIHQNHIFRARTKSSYVLPEWLMYYTNSEQGQNYFKEAAKQTTNLASINLTQLRACPIPLPPLEEQRRIVAEVERRLESARAVESAVKTGLKRAAWLRQAVLRSAFEGRLS